MKKYKYEHPDKDGNTVENFIYEDEIITHYFPVWSKGMKRIGKEDEISHKHCIEDFCTIHGAWEIE